MLMKMRRKMKMMKMRMTNDVNSIRLFIALFCFFNLISFNQFTSCHMYYNTISKKELKKYMKFFNFFKFFVIFSSKVKSVVCVAIFNRIATIFEENSLRKIDTECVQRIQKNNKNSEAEDIELSSRSYYSLPSSLYYNECNIASLIILIM